MYTLFRRARINAVEYYASPWVRRRIREYCGLHPGSSGTAIHVRARPDAGGEDSWNEELALYPVEDLDALLDRGIEVTRSLQATGALLLVLDIDYRNPDRPDEAFTHPVETFHKLEPTYQAARAVLRESGIPSIDLMTGQGYHFTTRIPFAHPAFGAIARLSRRTPAWLRSHPRRAPSWSKVAIRETEARGYAGLGLVAEFLAHQVLRRVGTRTDVPVVLNTTLVGAGPLGRECISLDLSAFSDPLDIRHVRTAFSVYQKHLPAVRAIRAPDVAPLAVIPRRGRPLTEVLETRVNLELAAEWAQRARATIPSAGSGLLELVRRYRSSKLGRFHRAYDAELPDLDQARDDRRQLDVEGLPPCVGACLAQPNDLLLRPEYLQNLTRLLLARGWRARRIASLVQSVYEEDHRWERRWELMHPGLRAESYARTFAGSVLAGMDQLVDFNCYSTQEKGMCPGTGCGHELIRDRERLLEARP